MLLTLSGVQLLERFLPAIEELYLAQNDLADLPKPSTETLDQVLDGSTAGDGHSFFSPLILAVTAISCSVMATEGQTDAVDHTSNICLRNSLSAC